MSTQEIFEKIYRDNAWAGEESCSGPGSTVFRTRLLRPALTQFLKELRISSMLDVPCGDFNWMRLTELPGISYIGADIVSRIVDQNTERYADASRRFVCLDMTVDPLPTADLILCRDGLVHLSYQDIDATLRQMRRSGARYLLATTFEAHPVNEDIATGGWRPLNLRKPPFSFPAPIRTLWDGPRPDGTWPDKMLALYELPDLPSLHW